jgi:hypothetical protein
MSESASISVDIKGIPADRRALAQAFRRRRGVGGRIAVIVAAMVFALTVTFGRDALFQYGTMEYPLAATLSAILGLILFFAVLAIFARRARRWVNDPRAPFLRGFNLSADEDGVRLASENFETHYRWPGILRVQETGAHLFLYTDGAQAIIVPKRCFAVAEDAARFAALVKTHVEA